jgi:hypothetical protein
MKHNKIVYVAQAIPAAVLLLMGVTKFMGTAGEVELFTLLEMEPHGRYLIGVLEVTAALLLLSPQAAIGSLLTVGIMCGAIIAHATRIGLVFRDDGGMLFGLLVLVVTSATVVLIARRRELPVVGKTL